MQAEEGESDQVLKGEPSEVVAGADRIGERQERMLAQIAVVHDHPLADPVSA